MSSYRDDTQETAVASSSAWLGLSAIVDEVAKASSATIFGLMVLHADGARAADAVVDRAVMVVSEQARASDAVISSMHASVTVRERARAADAVLDRLEVLVKETARVSDVAFGRLRALTLESSVASDAVIAQRLVRTLVEERARMFDAAIAARVELVAETCRAADAAIGRMHARDRSDESALASDSLLEQQQVSGLAVDHARMMDWAGGRLHAADLVSDVAAAQSWVPDPIVGQVWSAPVDGWAMSRWSPVGVRELVAINGVLFGVGDDGVFAFDSDAETVSARIETGLLDVGGAALVRPSGCSLGLELAGGTLDLDVATTQDGQRAIYRYAMGPYTAGAMTTARVPFGRGLRGRYFAFAFSINARRAVLDDASILTIQTHRRT